MTVESWLLLGGAVGGLLFVGGPWLLAYSRSRRVRLWRPSRAAAPRRLRWTAEAYGPVWFSHHLPHASFRPHVWRATGTLYLTDTQAQLIATNGQTTVLEAIRSVELGGFGRNPWTAIWVKVSYIADGTTPRVAFVCDARWWGWRPLSTRSCEDLADALVAIQLRATTS